MNLKFIIILKPEVSYIHALFENLKFSLKNITHENPKFFHAKSNQNMYIRTCMFYSYVNGLIFFFFHYTNHILSIFFVIGTCRT